MDAVQYGLQTCVGGLLSFALVGANMHSLSQYKALENVAPNPTMNVSTWLLVAGAVGLSSDFLLMFFFLCVVLENTSIALN